jgi:hypothetical protein
MYLTLSMIFNPLNFFAGLINCFVYFYDFTEPLSLYMAEIQFWNLMNTNSYLVFCRPSVFDAVNDI